jgi:hypothetical protein
VDNKLIELDEIKTMSERDCIYFHQADEGSVCTNDHSLRWPKCWIEETGINDVRECSLFNCKELLDSSAGDNLSPT